MENSLLQLFPKMYSSEWHKGDEPYYPVNNEKNNLLYEKYPPACRE